MTTVKSLHYNLPKSRLVKSSPTDPELQCSCCRQSS